jgi:hypothetical protein
LGAKIVNSDEAKGVAVAMIEAIGSVGDMPWDVAMGALECGMVAAREAWRKAGKEMLMAADVPAFGGRLILMVPPHTTRAMAGKGISIYFGCEEDRLATDWMVRPAKRMGDFTKEELDAVKARLDAEEAAGDEG